MFKNIDTVFTKSKPMNTWKWVLHHFIGNMMLTIFGGFLLALGDLFLFHFFTPNAPIDENLFQMMAFYSTFYFIMSYATLFFLIPIFLTILTLKSKLPFVVIMIIGLSLGLLFGIITKDAIWSYYIHDEKKIKHIIVLSIAGLWYPIISRFVQKILKLNWWLQVKSICFAFCINVLQQWIRLPYRADA